MEGSPRALLLGKRARVVVAEADTNIGEASRRLGPPALVRPSLGQACRGPCAPKARRERAGSLVNPKQDAPINVAQGTSRL